MTGRTLVAGVGNIFFGDDGFGGYLLAGSTEEKSHVPWHTR